MRIDICESRIPELAGLNRIERQIIFSQALKAMNCERPKAKWLPALFCSFATVPAMFAVPFFWELLNQQIHGGSTKALLLMSCVALCGFGGGFIGQRLFVRKLRPYLRRCRNELL